MMKKKLKTRRVITRIDSDGKARFEDQGPSLRHPALESWPGFEMAEIWATESTPDLSETQQDLTETFESYVPAPGGTRFRLVRFPGVGEGEPDLQRLRDEGIRAAPGLGETLEEEEIGMHTTPTIDYGVVLLGKIILELDDGQTTVLEAGDCFVQNGTRHRWHNPEEEACVFAVVMVGARV